MTRKPTAQEGFTLLEVMVVLLIIGILLGMATLSIGDGARRHAREAMRLLQHSMVLAAREAVINQQERGVRFFSGGYVFLMLDKKNRWHAPENDRFFRVRTLPANSAFFLEVEGRPVEIPSVPLGVPHLFVFSSGEQTPFRLEMRASGGALWRLTGDLKGALKMLEIQPDGMARVVGGGT